MLRIELALPGGIDLAEYEWREAPKNFREALIPAALLNRYGKVAIEDIEPPMPDWMRDDWAQ